MVAGGRSRLARLLRDSPLYGFVQSRRGAFDERDRRRWREVERFRANEGAVLRRVTGDDSGASVLFAAPSMPGLYRIRVEAMMAKALQARDCRAIWVIDRNDLWHEEHLRAFGFREFVLYDDYTPPRAELEALADELLRGCDELEDVLGLKHGGYDIGFHAASRAMNQLRRGRLDLADPEVAEKFRWTIAQSLSAAIAADAIVRGVRPDKHVATAQNLTPWAEFSEAALRHDVDLLYWMPAQVEESLLWRRYAYADRHEHFFTLAPETWDRVRSMPWSADDGASFLAGLRESYVTGNWFHRKKLGGKRVKTREEVVAELGLDPAKKIAVVFTHVLYDATFWFGKNLFGDYVGWLVETAKAAAANPGVNWVIKLHPENVRRSEENVGRYELENLEEFLLLRDVFAGGWPDHVKLMTPENDTSTSSLFDFADYALTVRGTVGLEFPCFGVPTLTGGTGGYSGRGFTIDSETPEEYLDRLARIQDIPRMAPERVALAQRFSYGVFHLKPVPFPSFESHLLPDDEWDRGWSSHSFALTARAAEEVRSAPDLNRFADWALRSGARDLLAPEADERLRPLEAEALVVTG
jgi:hypothetical protein